jgi:hypothetical protein
MVRKKRPVLYVANGNSHGPGWLAKAIVAAVQRREDCQITFVSNANGLGVLRAAGARVRDLALPANAPFLAAQCKYLQQMQVT